jgi:hypothetical protein
LSLNSFKKTNGVVLIFSLRDPKIIREILQRKGGGAEVLNLKLEGGGVRDEEKLKILV